MAKPSRKDRKIAKMRLARSPTVPSKAPQEREIPPPPISCVRLIQEASLVPALEPEADMEATTEEFFQEYVDEMEVIEDGLRSLVRFGLVGRLELDKLTSYTRLEMFRASCPWHQRAKDRMVDLVHRDEDLWSRFRVRARRTGLLMRIAASTPGPKECFVPLPRDTKAA